MSRTTSWTAPSRRRRAAVVAGLGLVPALVAGALAWGLYDPVDDLDRIEAAVVSLDEPVEVDGDLVPLGRQVVAALTAGVGLDGEPIDVEGAPTGITWTLTDTDGAQDGLTTGRYAAVVTIPEDFSAAATSLSAKDPDDAGSATIDVATADDGPVADSAVAAAVGDVVAATLGGELTTTYVENLYVGFSDVAGSLSDAADGATELRDGSGQLADGLAASGDGAQDLATGLGELSSGTSQLADGTGDLADGAGAGADGADALADGLARLSEGSRSLPADTRSLADGAQEVAGGTGELASQLGLLADGLDEAATGAAALPEGTGTLAGLAGQVDDGVAGLAGGTAGVSDLAGQSLAACQDGGGEACTTLLQQLVGTADGVAGGAADLTAASAGLAGGLAELDEQAAEVPAGIREAADGARAAADGTSQLADGAQQLADGSDALADGLPALTSGIAASADGARELADGTSQLAAGVRELDSAAGQLADGAGSAASGAGELADGTAQLGEGATGLTDGADQLASGLAEGAEQVPTYDESQRRRLADVVAAPVATTSADVSTTGQRGIAYLAVLAAGIGALATFLVLRAVPRRAVSSRSGSLRLALQAFAPAVAVVLLQAVLVTLVLAVTLDLTLGRTLAVAGVLLVVGLALAATNQALVAWLGGAGRLVSVAVLALSVPAALVGTAPEVVRAVVGWTPLAAATDALRAAVLADGAGGAVATLLVWTVAALALSVLAVRRVRSVGPARIGRLSTRPA
ncbi:hypothetical protein [Jannaschia sp. R86511]|uniref:hypothetical protein n=1 Tax=Jannaschia sp. R86511 TaxID=3093853 RepID=UPI0036D2F07C